MRKIAMGQYTGSIEALIGSAEGGKNKLVTERMYKGS